MKKESGIFVQGPGGGKKRWEGSEEVALLPAHLAARAARVAPVTARAEATAVDARGASGHFFVLTF